LRVNEQIRYSRVRLISESNEQVGIIPTHEALNMAREAGLDLVEVSPTAEPPVCRIMDYGKWLYQQKRKQKLNQKKQHSITLKEIRLRPKIDDHDREIKISHAAKFLEKGHKVQFTILFRGREMMHQEYGIEMFNEILNTLADTAKLEREPVKLGRRMTMVVAPK